MARVLIVDDEPSVLRLLGVVLREDGHEVLEANDGRTALDRFAVENIDTALVDLRLPGIDGQDLISRMRASKEGVPIIVVSGAGTKEDVTNALRLGCYDYIEKPILDFDRFRVTVNRAIEQRAMQLREREYLEELRTAHDKQEKQLQRLQMLYDVATALQGTFEENHLLRMILTCATSGQALGYNRASVFLLSPDASTLHGTMALGPSSGEEAGEIWSRLAGTDLSHQLELCKAAVEENEFSRLISRLSIPTSESNEIVATCVRERRAFVVHEARHSPNVSRSFADTIRVDEFACAPLIARGEVFGVLIVDNLFTRRPILEADSQVLSTFANQAALALATVRGYQRLQTQVVQVQRMQERLVEAERMAAVGNVAAQVAHEIRNPLFVIGGYARRLAGLSDIPHEAAECAHVIIDEAGRLGNILARVLDYLQESQGTLERADLNAVAEAAIDSVRETIDAHQVVFRTDLHDLPEVEIDTRLMEQVIVSLLLYALSATRPGDRVDLSTRLEDDLVRLDLHDTGPAIPSEDLPQVFNPFYKSGQDGRGAGIAVVNKIVHAFGGAVRVRSETSEGTTLSVLLPTAETKHRVAVSFGSSAASG